jgi:nucleoside-diphosphate-sugar epimerase
LVYGSGNQRHSMCRVSTAAKAVCDVFNDPEKFSNRTVYVADYTVSMNQLVPLLEDARPGWNVVKIDLDEFLAMAKKLWDEDRKKGLAVNFLSPGRCLLVET